MAFEIVIPRLGWSMEEGTFVGWLKKDGDNVRRGDALFELEGEKATQEIESVDEGTLRIPASGPKAGTVLKVGAVIGHLVAAGESSPSQAADSPPSASSAHAGEPARAPVAAPSVRRLARELDVDLKNLSGTGPKGRILSEDVQRVKSTRARAIPIASPRARRVAAELGVDWKQLTGSGALGRIREQDVRFATNLRASQATAAKVGGKRIALSSRRKVIFQRMTISRQQTVPVTLTTKADATNLVNLREQFKSLGGQTVVPSYQDIVTKLVAEVLKQHPLLAGRWDEDAIVMPDENGLDIGMAVDTDDGLLVPVIRDVGSVKLTELARQSRELVERARANSLGAAELQGSVFTITNLGAFGIDAFTPIINYPESAILGLGAIRREAIVQDSGAIVAQAQLTLNLTFDHRIIDGAPAARFLQTLVSAIASPSAWLLGDIGG